MSHGKIYQVGTKPIAECDYVAPEYFYENHDSYADWIGDAEVGEERNECIENLVHHGLKGLFELDKDGNIVYMGEGNFLQQWVDAIHEKAQAITVENVTNFTQRAALRDILDGSHTDSIDRVVIEEWSGNFAEPIADLITFAKYNMKPGDVLHFGAVIDFHY